MLHPLQTHALDQLHSSLERTLLESQPDVDTAYPPSIGQATHTDSSPTEYVAEAWDTVPTIQDMHTRNATILSACAHRSAREMMYPQIVLEEDAQFVH